MHCQSRELNRRVGYSYRIFEQFNDELRGQWEEVSRVAVGNLFTSPKFVSAVEKAFGNQARFWKVILFDDQRPVAVASLCLFPVDLLILASEQVRRRLGFIGRIAPSLTKLPVLLCGLPVSLGKKTC